MLYTFLLLFLTFMVQASPIANAKGDLTKAFVGISKVLDTIQLNNCTTTNASLPLESTNPPLPRPSLNLTLKYVTIGRGTQNYTCANETATPAAAGAVATLFDASCIASAAPPLLHMVPSGIKSLPLNAFSYIATLTGQIFSGSKGSMILGEHYFNAAGQPFFDLRDCGTEDWIAADKVASAPAPVLGQGDDQNVPWLKLGFKDGKGLREVYRMHTAGGKAPATCKGQGSVIEVEYAAEYWFYGL